MSLVQLTICFYILVIKDIKIIKNVCKLYKTFAKLVFKA